MGKIARVSLSPTALAIAGAVGPAMASARLLHEVWPPDNGPNHAADYRTRRASNKSAGARADGDAFDRSSLGRNRHRRHKQRKHSCLENRGHDKTPWSKLRKRDRIEAMALIPREQAHSLSDTWGKFLGRKKFLRKCIREEQYFDIAVFGPRYGSGAAHK
jgi:hypothetical protein